MPIAALVDVAQIRLLVRQRRLRPIRERVGVSQAELADAVGVSQRTVSMWESGAREPRHEAAARLAEVLGDLLRMVEEMGDSGEAPSG